MIGEGSASPLHPGRVKHGRLMPVRKKTKAGARSRSERSFAHTLIGRTRSCWPSGSVSLVKIFRESTGAIGAREPPDRAPSLSFFVAFVSRLKDRSRNFAVCATFSKIATTIGDSRISCGPEESSSFSPRGPRASFSAPSSTFYHRNRWEI